MKQLQLLIYFFMVVSLSGCMKDLLTSKSNIHDFYTLSAVESARSAHKPLTLSLGVPRPMTGPGLNNEKIILQTQPFKVDYYASGRWIADLPRIVQARMIESFENTGELPKVSSANSDMQTDYLLQLEIRDFQAEYLLANAPPVVHVKVVFKLLAAHDRRIVKTGEFAARVAAPQNSLDSIMATFDQAFLEVEHNIVSAVLNQLRKQNK